MYKNIFQEEKQNEGCIGIGVTFYQRMQQERIADVLFTVKIYL